MRSIAPEPSISRVDEGSGTAARGIWDAFISEKAPLSVNAMFSFDEDGVDGGTFDMGAVNPRMSCCSRPSGATLVEAVPAGNRVALGSVRGANAAESGPRALWSR